MSEFYRDKWFKEVLNIWTYKKNQDGATDYWFFTKYFVSAFSYYDDKNGPKYPHMKGYSVTMKDGVLSRIKYTDSSYVEIGLMAQFQELKDRKKLRILNKKLAKSLLHPESVKDSRIELSARPNRY